MNIIKYIKLLFQRRKILKLDVGKSEPKQLSDTNSLITIQEITKILNDENEFSKLLDPKRNKEFFHDDLCFDSYIQAVKDYISFFLQRGTVFDKAVLSRASIITGTKFHNNRPSKYATLNQIACNLLLSPNIDNNHIRFNELNEKYETDYKYDSLTDFTNYMTNPNLFHSYSRQICVAGENVEAHELRDCLLDLSSDFCKFSSILYYDDIMSNNFNNLHLNSYDKENRQKKNIISKFEFNAEKYALNPDFENLVLGMIPKDITDKGTLSYEIYKAVCLATQYDAGYFVMRGKDKFSQDFIDRLRRTDISDLTTEKNRLICTTFSELYCYFLSKYGIKSLLVESKSPENINNNICHYLVQVNTENDVIYADATNGVVDDHGLNMTDMTRAKLGIEPANFKSTNGKTYGSDKQHKASSYKLQSQLDEIKSQIDEISAKSNTDEITVSDRINIMKRQLQKLPTAKLGNYATVQYMTMLFDHLFSHYTSKNNTLVSISKSLYVQEGEDIYSYFPIVYLQKDKDEYEYYCYNQENGLKQMELKDLKHLLDTGKLNYIVGKENRIPGLHTDTKQHDTTADVSDNLSER